MDILTSTSREINQEGIRKLAKTLRESYKKEETGMLTEVLVRTAESELIESEIWDVCWEATKRNLILEGLIARRIGPESIPGSSITVTLHTKDAMSVYRIGEGAEVTIDTEKYTYFTLTPEKWGVRPLITTEMIEDNKFDIVAMNVDEAGYQLAKNRDSAVATQIEAGDTAASNTVTGSNPVVPADLISGMKALWDGDYVPTDLILSTGIAADIMNTDTFVEADKAGITNPSKGLIGKIFGMTVWVSNAVTANYAYIIDRNQALIMAVKRPLTMEHYKDIIRDMHGVVFTERWKIRYFRDAANVVIQSS